MLSVLNFGLLYMIIDLIEMNNYNINNKTYKNIKIFVLLY